jgi:carboxypeptidase PM20D1
VRRPSFRRLSVTAAFLLLIATATATRIARVESVPLPPRPAPLLAMPDGAAERLAGAVRIRTISPEAPVAFDGAAFDAMHAYLAEAFPRVQSALTRETVSAYSLLYTWPGRDRSLKPILLLGHLDVVPVENGTEKGWQHEPFVGRVADGYVWGRGAIDNKSTVLGTLEAVEMLLAEGFQPERTVHLAFGHDEEVGGTSGAASVAALLRSRGVELEMVIDEGGVIGDGLLPGVSGPVALVGLAEKGFATIELTTHVEGGHSSIPPRSTAVGILAAAVARLEEHQMPARLEGPSREMFERIAPRLPLPQRLLFQNLWLTTPLVLGRLEDSPTTNAMVRTTTAPTIFSAGTKDNVLPGAARATVNFRILPGDTVASVVAHVRRAISDDRVEVRLAGRFTSEPSPVSSSGSRSFAILAESIRSVLPDALVTPYLVVVATDARHYQDLSAQVFRFLPLRLRRDDLARIHGRDERIGIREYGDAILLYRTLLVRAAG